MIREEVRQFAYIMEFKLKINDHKGGWVNHEIDYLFKRLREETIELEKAIAEGSHIDMMLEAADIANFALMIANNATKEKRDEDED